MSTSAAPCRCPYRILVADEFPLVRRGLRVLLGSDPDLEVCGEVSNDREVLSLASMKKLDLIIMGLARIEGLKAIASIRDACPEARIIAMHTEEDSIQGALNSGAHGYILRSDDESELLAAIQQLRLHRAFPSWKIHELKTRSTARYQKADDKSEHELTKREIEIVRLLALGNSNKEVAVKLNLSTRTVEGHRNHIMHKMSFSNFSELVRFAIRKRLVTA